MSMPKLGLGTLLLNKNNDPNYIKTVIKNAVKIGYRRFDCAPVYFNEHLIGDALEEIINEQKLVKREELFITSKLPSPYHQKQHVELALKKTLLDLRLDYLDLYLIHWPVAFKYVEVDLTKRGYENEDIDESADGKNIDPSVSIHETWSAMEELVQKGLVRYIGVSNFPISLLHELLTKSTITPYVNQVELHPYLQQGNLLKYCAFRGVNVQAYSPLGSPGYKEQGEPNVLHDTALMKIAKKYSITVSQLCLIWALQRNTSICVKSASQLHQQENFNIFATEGEEIPKLVLSQDDLDEIAKLDQNYRYFRPEEWWGDWFLAVFE